MAQENAGGGRPPEKRFDPVEHYFESRSGRRRVRALGGTTRTAIGMAREAGPRLFGGLVASQLGTAVLLAAQVLFGKLALEAILRASAEGGSIRPAISPLVGLVAAGALASVVSTFQSLAQRLLGELVQRNTLSAVTHVTTTVDLEYFESPSFFDDVQRVQAGALIRPLTMSQGLIQLVGGVVGAVGLSIAIIAIEPLLLPVLAASAVPLMVLSRRTGTLEFRFSAEQTPGARLRQYLVNTLIGRSEAKELRAFGIGSALRQRWLESYADYFVALRGLMRQRLVLATLGALVTVLVTSAAFALVLSFVLSGRLSLSSAGAAVLAVRLLSTRIQSIFSGVGSLLESALFLDDLRRFLSLPGRMGGETAVGAAGSTSALDVLAVDDVRFSYPEAAGEALRGVSMRISAGQMVALVGENGSGKTTLAKLVAGLYQPDAGHVLWNGTPLERQIDAVRRRIGVIFQDFVRYQLRAADNVSFGDIERQDGLQAIRAAARQAGADDFLTALPQGYDTNLGKAFAGGVDLSGGQWQRVALSRAFYRSADLLILDEPTASLDARSEHELFEHVRALARGRAVLMVSHRFSTVRSADHIYVLHEGEVVEDGSHEELMTLDGRYAELYRLQAESYR